MLCYAVKLFLVIITINKGCSQQQLLPRIADLKVFERESTFAEIGWEQPKFGDIYQKYFITVVPSSAIVRKPLQEGTTKRRIDNLCPGERYVIGIVGITANGRMSPRLVFELFSKPIPPGNVQLEILDKVKILIGLSEMSSVFTLKTIGVRVSWTPLSRAFTNVAGYDAEITPNENSPFRSEVLKVREKNGNARVFANLIPGKLYAFSVRSYVGPPGRRVHSKAITKELTLPPLPPFSVEATEIKSDQISVKIKGSLTGAYTEFFLELAVLGARESKIVVERITTKRSEYTFYNLNMSSKYILQVFSVSNKIKSNSPMTLKITTKGPVDFKVIHFNYNTVTLHWMQPFHTPGNARYIVKVKNEKKAKTDFKKVFGSIHTPNFTKQITVTGLLPGNSYIFELFTFSNGTSETKRKPLARVLQTTIPLTPFLRFIQTEGDDIVGQVDQPTSGECPQVEVSYSPPLPGQSSVHGRKYELGKNFTISGLPRNLKYSIYIRCVSNSVESDALIFSSTVEIDARTGIIRDRQDFARIRLSCARPKKTPGRNNTEVIFHDACCGWKPIRSSIEKCCGETVLPVGVEALCCMNTFYSPESETCCENGVVVTRSSSCPSVY